MPALNFKKDICPATIKFVALAENDMNLCQIQEKIRIMYSHIVNITKLLRAKGMLFTKKEGRELKITFSEKGETFKHHCQQIKKLWEAK